MKEPAESNDADLEKTSGGQMETKNEKPPFEDPQQRMEDDDTQRTEDLSVEELSTVSGGVPPPTGNLYGSAWFRPRKPTGEITDGQ